MRKEQLSGKTLEELHRDLAEQIKSKPDSGHLPDPNKGPEHCHDCKEGNPCRRHRIENTEH